MPKSHFGRVRRAVAPMVLQKGQGRAAAVETQPLDRRELIQSRKGQRDPEREPRPGAVLEPTKVIHQILASMEKDINDETRIGPNENVGGRRTFRWGRQRWITPSLSR